MKKEMEKKEEISLIKEEAKEVKKEAKKVAKEVKEAAKAAKKTVKKEKAAVKAKAAKVVKKSATVKSAKLQTKVMVQYQDREWDADTMVQTVKDIMEYDLKLDPSSVKKIDFYVNTEEDRVYFVADGDIKGSFAL